MSGYEVILTPRELSATPTAAPYRLDKLTGSVLILPDKITLNDLTGKHGDGTIHLSGTGSAAADAKWDFKLSGQDVMADADLMKALPDTMGEMLKSTDFKGKITFDFSKLTLAPGTPVVAAPPRWHLPPAPRPVPMPRRSDVDFAVKVYAADASVNLGVPMQKVAGAIDVAGTTRNARLAHSTDRSISRASPSPAVR